MKSKTKIFLLCRLVAFFFLLLSFSLNHATIRYVSKTGSSTPPYTSWATAADSIQKCIDICVFGDTIYVANGVYEEQVIMIPGLSLIGAGADSCTIDTRHLVTSSTFRAVEFADSCLLKGFHVIVYHNSNMGRGIYAVGSGLITQNRVTNSIQGIHPDTITIVYQNFCLKNRIGIRLINSNSIVRKNCIYLDYPGGFGILIDAFNFNYTPIIDSNYIETKSNGIGKSFGAKPLITNNTIILRGINAKGITLSSSDSGKVFNNLIYAEEGFQGIDNNGTQYLQLYNNYVTGNFYDSPQFYVVEIGPDNIVKNNVVTNVKRGIEAWGTENLVFQYNNVWNADVPYSGFTPDSTNLSVDPMIVNGDTTQGELDFHLQLFSPLIDAGDAAILDKDSTRSDIGLYGGPFGESYIYTDLPPKPPRNITAEVDSLIRLSWNRNTETDLSYYNLYMDTVSNFTIDTAKLISSQADTFYIQTVPNGVESLYYKLTAVDSQGNVSNPSEELAVLITSIKEETQLVSSYQLYQNYPNPFNPSTKIGYKLNERGYVKLYLYDIKGETVEVLVNQIQEGGYYEVDFTAENNLTSGIYIYQIMVRGDNNTQVFSDIKKMVYLK